MTASKHPQRVGRKLDVVLARGDLRRGVDAHAQLAALEQKLPALAQIHLRLQRHGNAIRAGAVGDAHALEADHAGRRAADRRGRTQHPVEAMAFDHERAALAEFLLERAGQAIVAAHELGGEHGLGAV